MTPESLGWGKGAPAVVCPAPEGAGLRFWLAPLGTEKKEGGEGEGDGRGGDRGGMRRNLECFCVRAPLPPLSVPVGPVAPRAGGPLWRNSSLGCAAVSAAPTPLGWRGAPGILPHRTCMGDREKSGQCQKKWQMYSPGHTLSIQHTCCCSVWTKQAPDSKEGGPEARCSLIDNYFYPSRGTGGVPISMLSIVCWLRCWVRAIQLPKHLCHLTRACALVGEDTEKKILPYQAPGQRM